MTEDERHRLSDEVQKMTDDNIRDIENVLEKKQKEVLLV
jgi:ribosome recycling factor